MKKIIFLLMTLSSLPMTVSAYECQVPGYKVMLYFGNGMLTAKKNALDDLQELENRFGNTYIDPSDPGNPVTVVYDIAYNHNEAIWLQLFQVFFVQKQNEIASNFFYYLSHTNLAPEWFRDVLENLNHAVNNLEYVSDADLQQHVAEYRKAAFEGNKVLVVAHSQGNFYANRAYNLLYHGGILPNREERPFGIVAVASPADEVGEPGSELPYTTSTDDLIINAFRQFYPQTLPGNIANLNDGDDLLRHFFIATYLKGDVSGPKIIDDMQFVLDNKITRYCSNFQGYYLMRDYVCNIWDPDDELSAFFYVSEMEFQQTAELVEGTKKAWLLIYGSGSPDFDDDFETSINYDVSPILITGGGCEHYLVGNEDDQTHASDISGISVEIGDLFQTCTGDNAKYYVNPDGVCYTTFNKLPDVN